MSKRWYLVAGVLALMFATYFGLGGTHAPVPNIRLSVHFINVGQGDSILITTASGKAVLVDGGPTSEGSAVCDYLSNQQIGHLNAIILTHPHADHVGGLADVMERLSVGRVYDAPQEQGLRSYRRFMEEVERKDIPYEEIHSGSSIHLDNDISIEFLSPPEPPMDGTDADADNNSVVLRVTCGDVAYLLAGDVRQEGEEALLKSGRNLRAQVLKVSNHGSMYGTSDELLSAVTPHWAVISVGEENDYEHPHPETLRRLLDAGVRVLRTDLNGSIVLSTDGTHIRESVERDQ